MHELGLLDGFLKLPHQRSASLTGSSASMLRIADSPGSDVQISFVAFMPQWDFLNFLRESGSGFPGLMC